MRELTDIADTRQGQILQELAALGLSAAREVHARLMAAETPDETAQLARALHLISRSVRQTLALEPRLVRDHARNIRDAASETQRLATRRVDQKKQRVRLAVERLIWTEAEDEEAERLVDDLDDLLDAEALADGFVETPVEAVIEKVRADLGLAATVILGLDGQAVTPPAESNSS